MKHPMSKKEYRAALARYGLTQGRAGWLFNGKSETSGRRWASETGAPFTVALVIAIMDKLKLDADDIEKIGAPWRKKRR